MNLPLNRQIIAFKSFYIAAFGVMAFVGLALLPSATANAADSFFLKSGDRVCFYGDSITEQRFYGVDIETYVLTRFPNLKVNFVNSGVGGDTVGGGWAGPIDLRLNRDVFPFKPNVVTIMLGMNDGRYTNFNEINFAAYTNGYEHIIHSLQQHLPGVKIVLIQPTPYDDVTYPASFPGGYNAVLSRYCAFVRQLAVEHNLTCVDFMTPLVELMQKARAQSTGLARELIPGRIHPSPATELVMARLLLQAWGAPATVTSVAIGVADKVVLQSDYTTVTGLKEEAGRVSWTQKDQSLPFPVLGLHENWPQYPPFARHGGTLNFFWPAPQPKWDCTNTATEAIANLSGFYQALDQELLSVSGLKPGNYQLKINGQTIGKFNDQQLRKGINLACYRTPMLEQSYNVLALVWEQTQWRFFAWRGIQTELSDENDHQVQNAADSLVAALENQRQEIINLAYVASQPALTHYELTRAN